MFITKANTKEDLGKFSGKCKSCFGDHALVKAIVVTSGSEIPLNIVFFRPQNSS